MRQMCEESKDLGMKTMSALENQGFNYDKEKRKIKVKVKNLLTPSYRHK